MKNPLIGFPKEKKVLSWHKKEISWYYLGPEDAFAVPTLVGTDQAPDGDDEN